MIVKKYVIDSITKICDEHNVPSQRANFLAINYYPPDNNFDIRNPIFPFHTDFGYINCLLSDGPTMILDPITNLWSSVNLAGNRQMFQVGAAMPFHMV